MIKISKGGYKKDWGDTVNITPPRLHVIWPSVLLRFNSRNCTKPSPLRCEHVGWSAKRGIRSTPGALTSYGTVVAPLFRRRPASFVSRTNAFPWDVSAITRRPETGWRYNDTSISYTSDARTPTGELLSRPTTAPPPGNSPISSPAETNAWPDIRRAFKGNDGTRTETDDGHFNLPVVKTRGKRRRSAFWRDVRQREKSKIFDVSAG